MAPAAADTLKNLFNDTKTNPTDYDLIVTGDLGHIGKDILEDLCKTKGYNIKANYDDLLRGAPTGTAAKFILTQFLGLNLFNNSDFACLQIPTSYDLGIELELDKKTIIKRAHRRNIAVQYWTINDAEEMRELIELGCDCIMTDDPKLMKSVLEEYK